MMSDLHVKSINNNIKLFWGGLLLTLNILKESYDLMELFIDHNMLKH